MYSLKGHIRAWQNCAGVRSDMCSNNESVSQCVLLNMTSGVTKDFHRHALLSILFYD